MANTKWLNIEGKRPYGIKAVRHAKGWSAQRLANEIGVNIRLVQKWEANESIPSVLNARKVADALGVSLDDLY